MSRKKLLKLFTCNGKTDAGGIRKLNKKRDQKCCALYFVGLLIYTFSLFAFNVAISVSSAIFPYYS